MPAHAIVALEPDRAFSTSTPIRVSEVVSALSAALDLGEGRPNGHSVRSCLLGMRVAQEIGLSHDAQADLYYALLLKDAGSNRGSPLFQPLGAGDVRAKRDAKTTDRPRLSWGSLQSAFSHIRATNHSCSRTQSLFDTAALNGAAVARRMGLSESAVSAISSLGERWDGSGNPHGLRGEEIPLPAGILSLAQTLDLSCTENGPASALETARKHSGSWFKPDLVRAADSLDGRGALWTGLKDANRRVIELEPYPQPLETNQETLDDICLAFAELIDAKTPFAYRHSTGVAGAAVFIARTLGLSDPEVVLLRRAALLHDIGKLAVPRALLEKPGKLSSEEWAIMRRHARYTYEILNQVPGFSPLAEIAGSHHEKLDGSGYFRGLKGRQMSLSMRILVVADIFDALSAKRSYREALPLDQIFRIMRLEAPHALDEICLDALMKSSSSAVSNTAGLAQLSASVQPR